MNAADGAQELANGCLVPIPVDLVVARSSLPLTIDSRVRPFYFDINGIGLSNSSNCIGFLIGSKSCRGWATTNGSVSSPFSIGTSDSSSMLQRWPFATPIPGRYTVCLSGGKLPPARCSASVFSEPAVEIGSLVVARAVSHLATGRDHAFAFIMPGMVKCWGRSHTVGLEVDRNVRELPTDMGESLRAVNLGSDCAPVQVLARHGTTCTLCHGVCMKCFGRFGKENHKGSGSGGGQQDVYIEGGKLRRCVSRGGRSELSRSDFVLVSSSPSKAHKNDHAGLSIAPHSVSTAHIPPDPAAMCKSALL